MTLTSKFSKDLSTLRAAANKEIYLDVKNPKLYKKLKRYYVSEGLELTGEDPDYDYVWKILTNCYQKPPKEVLFQPKSNKDIYIVNIPLTNDKLLCSRDKVEIKNDMILEMQ